MSRHEAFALSSVQFSHQLSFLQGVADTATLKDRAREEAAAAAAKAAEAATSAKSAGVAEAKEGPMASSSIPMENGAKPLHSARPPTAAKPLSAAKPPVNGMKPMNAALKESASGPLQPSVGMAAAPSS